MPAQPDANTTEQPNHALPASVQDVDEVSVELPLLESKAKINSDIHGAYGRTAHSLEQIADSPEARVYRSVARLFSFVPNYAQPGQPYLPYEQSDGMRSVVPEDLTAKDLDVVEALFEKSKDDAMRARFGDVLTIRKRRHAWWPLTVEAYFGAAERLLIDDEWKAVSLMHRGLMLAHRLGRRNDPWTKGEERVLRYLRERWPTDDGFFCYQLMRVLVDLRVGTSSEFAEIAGKLADRASKVGEAHKSRKYRQIEASCWSEAKDKERALAAEQLAAETYVTEADGWLQRKKPSLQGSAGCLAKAVEALRQARSKPERILEIKQRLSQTQREAMVEIETKEYNIDISPLVAAADKMMADQSLSKALVTLAMRPLVDLPKLKEDVLGQREFLWSHLMGSSQLDPQGRVTHNAPPLFSQKGQEFENALEGAMFEYARKSLWELRVAAWIQTGRRRIWQDHEPIFSDLEPLVLHNPFIPQSRAYTFQRGLYAGLSGDFLTSSYLLVPQLENSFRWVLEKHGADVSNLQSDLTQPVKLLGAIFDMPEFEKIFGAEYRFELRGHLIEKQGYDFRNRICHGFVSDAEAHAPAAVSIWWLTLRLCVDHLIGHGSVQPE